MRDFGRRNICPDTFLDEPVDFDGCSCFDLDSDLDGVDDCIDLCPNTPINRAVDSDGCTIGGGGGPGGGGGLTCGLGLMGTMMCFGGLFGLRFKTRGGRSRRSGAASPLSV